MKKVIWILVVIALGLLIWLGCRYYNLSNKVNGYVLFEINPSVELGVNYYGEVLEVVSVNEDADILTSDLDLVGLTIDDATDKIISSAIETGYINELEDDNAVVVTSLFEDEEKRIEYEKYVIEKVDSCLEDKKVYALVAAQGVDEEIKAEAESYDISYGKMLLVNRLVEADSTLNKSELVDETVQSIQNKFKEEVQNRYEEATMTQEQLKEQWQVEKQKKIEEHTSVMEQKKEVIWEEIKGNFGDVSNEEKSNIVNGIIEQEKIQIKEGFEVIKEEIISEKPGSKVNYPVIETGNKADREIQSRKK